MILYSHTIPHRLRYIADFIGREMTGNELIITDSISAFTGYTGPRINYSNEKITEEEIRIGPQGLLFEKEIRPQQLNCFETNGYKAFFPAEGDFPFDIFAASFYLLSRYEEYLPHEKDRYGRFAHTNALAFKESFLDIPLVNVWIQSFKKTVRDKFSLLAPAYGLTENLHTGIRFLPTYDIDEAYSFKHKQWWRSAGAAVKDLLRGKWDRYRLRRKVLNGKAEDPFDSYAWMDDLHRPHALKPKYFFLLAQRTGRYDRNILPAETALQTLIRDYAKKYDIGIHPSWQSGDDPSLVQQEIRLLEDISKIKITASRQHFIRFSLPQTYRVLAETGIREDFSMGYGSINGFRASVASPFYWYDLSNDEPTSLLLYPFCFMEANSFFELKQTPAAALEAMRNYYRSVKQAGGWMISIWHNTFLGTDDLYKGWRDIYRQFVQEVTAETEKR